MVFSQFVTGISGAALGFLVVASVVEPPKPVALIGIHIDLATETVTYRRKVNSPTPIRAPFTNDLFDLDDERTVEACFKSSRTIFGPDEDMIQTFKFERFTGPDCLAALKPGHRYQVLSTVTPTDGPASEAWSNVFSIPAE